MFDFFWVDRPSSPSRQTNHTVGDERHHLNPTRQSLHGKRGGILLEFGLGRLDIDTIEAT